MKLVFLGSNYIFYMNRNTENIYLGKICRNICSIHFGIYSIELNRRKKNVYLLE